VLALGAKLLMTTLFGDAFEPAATPFALLLPGTVCLTLWSIVSLYVVAALERPGTTTVIQSVAMLVSLPAYYLAVRESGMTGAALVSSAVYAAVFVAGLVVFLRSGRIGLLALVPRVQDALDVRNLVGDAVRRLPRPRHA
jgi:O-antigen/teichoic acid export membrane protein